MKRTVSHIQHVPKEITGLGRGFSGQPLSHVAEDLSSDPHESQHYWRIRGRDREVPRRSQAS